MLSKYALQFTLAFVSLICVIDVHSSGFKIDPINPSSFGLANAGVAADVYDASMVYHNPAGLSALGSEQWSVGANYIRFGTSVYDARLDVAGLPVGTQVGLGQVNDDFLPDAKLPSVFYAKPLNPYVSFGLALTMPFGSELNHRIDTTAGVIQSLTKIKILDVQPALSYAFTESFAMGASIHVMHAQQRVIRNTPLPRSSFSLKGSDNAVGFGVGGLYTFNSGRTRIGVDYRSKVEFRFKGRPTAISSNINFPALHVTNQIVTPSQMQLGVSHKTKGKLSFHAGITRVNWRDFSSLDMGVVSPVSSVPALQILPTQTEALNFRNTTQYALGIRYQVKPAWQIRTGYLWGDGVGNNRTSPYASTLVSLQKQNWLTVGLGYRHVGLKPKAEGDQSSKPVTHWAWDGVIGVMPSSGGEIFGQGVNSANTSQLASVRAKTDMRAVMIGVQMSYFYH